MFRRAIRWKYPKSVGIRLLRCHASHITEKACSPGEAHHSFQPDKGENRKIPNYKKIFECFLRVWCLPVLLAPLFQEMTKQFNEFCPRVRQNLTISSLSLVSTLITRCCFHPILPFFSIWRMAQRNITLSRMLKSNSGDLLGPSMLSTTQTLEEIPRNFYNVEPTRQRNHVWQLNHGEGGEFFAAAVENSHNALKVDGRSSHRYETESSFRHG